MDASAFANKGMFDTWDSMMESYYGFDPMNDMSNKADAPYVMGTTGVRNVLYGPWLTAIIVTAANALGAQRDAPWKKSGYRLATAMEFGSTPGEGQTEGGAIPYSVMDTIDTLAIPPKTLANVIEMSTAEMAMEGKDDVLKWAELVDFRRKVILNSVDQSILAYAGAATAGNNLESIDRIISSYDEIANAGEGGTASNWNYEGKSRTGAASAYDAYVKHFSGSTATFALSYLDALMQNCIPFWDDGSVENKCWITGPDTLARMQQLIMLQFRGQMNLEPVQYTVNGAKTLPGQKSFTMVSMYDNIPAIMDKFVDKHYTTGASGISKVYLEDQNYVELAVGQPWQYQESMEYLATGKLGKRGIFHFVGEMTAFNFGCHGKLQAII